MNRLHVLTQLTVPIHEHVGGEFVDVAKQCVSLIERESSTERSKGFPLIRSTMIDELEPAWGVEFALNMAAISRLLSDGSGEISAVSVRGIGVLPDLQRHDLLRRHRLGEPLKYRWEEVKPNLTRQLAVFLQNFAQGTKLIDDAADSMEGRIEFVSERQVAGSDYTENWSTWRPGDINIEKTGFFVELKCHRRGMAAYASPAYALTWRNFGSLTSPAVGFLPPGCWIFGAQGKGQCSLMYDPNPVHIPTNFTPCTQRF